jgi:hypothetical protein
MSELDTIPFKYKSLDAPIPSLQHLSAISNPSTLKFDFTPETQYIRQYQEREVQSQKRNEEKAKRRLERQRRRAPGLSETGGILQPVKVKSDTSNSSLPDLSSSGKKVLDLQEFEHALSPVDQWDASMNKTQLDFNALMEVIQTNPSYINTSTFTVASQIALPTQQSISLPSQGSPQKAISPEHLVKRIQELQISSGITTSHSATPPPGPMIPPVVPMSPPAIPLKVVSVTAGPTDYEQKFIELGFSLDNVRSVVQRHGRNEKKILDTLYLDESAVLFSVEKRATYISYFQDLLEMGFPHSKIKANLVLFDLNRDQALDKLMEENS